MTSLKEEKVAIIGSGLIGRSWAMLFAASGYRVFLYDVNEEQLTSALSMIKDNLVMLEGVGLLRGTLSVEEQHGRISVSSDMQQVVSGAIYVQECVPEDLELKKGVFSVLDDLADEGCILASSTSSIVASKLSDHLTKRRNQVIVVHPTNPPFYCPATEISPSPWTDANILERTLTIQKEIGQVPVLIKKEVKGFVLNRLQYAIFSEAWRLIAGGYVSVEDVDRMMTEGLGTRYAFVGPMETCHLNAEGLENYMERYGENITKIAKGFGPVMRWEGEVAEHIVAEMDRRVPAETLPEKFKWRDTRLIELAKLKKEMKAKKKVYTE